MFQFSSFDLGCNYNLPYICMELLPYRAMPSSTHFFGNLFWISAHCTNNNLLYVYSCAFNVLVSKICWSFLVFAHSFSLFICPSKSWSFSNDTYFCFLTTLYFSYFFCLFPSLTPHLCNSHNPLEDVKILGFVST